MHFKVDCACCVAENQKGRWRHSELIMNRASMLMSVMQGLSLFLCRDKWRVNGVDISKHFSYYALEGGTGQSRWKHEVDIALCELCYFGGDVIKIATSSI